jgi:hypothetical protein
MIERNAAIVLTAKETLRLLEMIESPSQRKEEFCKCKLAIKG